MMTHSLPSSLPAGFWSKAYISTLEEADEVTMAMLMKRSIKVITNNSPWFLVITFILTCLYLKCLRMKAKEGKHQVDEKTLGKKIGMRLCLSFLS